MARSIYLVLEIYGLKVVGFANEEDAPGFCPVLSPANYTHVSKDVIRSRHENFLFFNLNILQSILHQIV